MDTEKITDRTEELIISAIDFVEKSGSLVAEQAPLIIQEFLAWRLVEASIYMALSVLAVGFFACIFLAITINLWKKAKLQGERFWWGAEFSESEQAAFWVSSVVMVLTTLVGTLTFVQYALVAVKIIVAPRVYLIEELPKLIGM
jgi:hypothetical protein